MTRISLTKSFKPALKFNGTTTYINCGTAASLRVETGNFTIESWVKPIGLPISTSRYTIVAYYNPGWIIDIVNDAGVYGYRFYDGATARKYNTTISMDWTHIVWTYQISGGILTLYINGVFKQQWGSVSITTSTNSLLLGRRSDGFGSFKGFISEVKMYNRCITFMEIEQHYNNSYINETGLVGYWKLNEGQGATVFDSSDGSNTGTITAGQWIENGGTVILNTRSSATRTQNTDTRFLVRDFENCGQLNGVNDYVNCGNGDSLNITNKLTICAWIYINSFSNNVYLISKNLTAYTDIQYALLLIPVQFKNISLYLNGGARGESALNSLKLMQWMHIAVVYNRAVVKYYINGMPSGSTSAYTSAITATDFDVNIGRRHPSNLYFPGNIDELLLFSRDLSDTEILELYLSNKINRTMLVGEWKFNEGNGLTVIDSSGNNNTGTWNGAGTYWSNEVPMKLRLNA